MFKDLNNYYGLLCIYRNTKSPKTKKETLYNLKRYSTFNSKLLAEYLYKMIINRDPSYEIRYIKPYVETHSSNMRGLFPELVYGSYIITNNHTSYTIPDCSNLCILDNEGNIKRTITNNNLVIREFLINLINYNIKNKDKEIDKEKVKIK